MARFNTTSHRAIPPVATTTSPIATVTATPNTRTFEGAPGFTRTAQAEAFLRATSAFHGGESTFYENGKIRDERLRHLVEQIAVEDFDWLFDFAQWLRGPGNIRTAALFIAVVGVRARLASAKTSDAKHTNRQLINVVCQRPDEPGELLAIWTSLYGRTLPKPVKRGLADAVRRLYNERSLLKYDTASKGYRFGDILNLVHTAPDPDKPWQGDLFQYALDRRHNPGTAVIPESLVTVRNNDKLRRESDPSRWLNGSTLREAGITWEDALSAVGDKVDKAKLWEALIPSMNIMALIRNLRNFDQAGVRDDVANQVMAKLQNEEVIARSRQFPFRFLAAYQATKDSLRWAYPLEQALGHSLANVPALPGRTLVLVDRSGSMFGPRMSERSELSRADGAAIFGTAIALRAQSADLVQYGTTSSLVPFKKGDAVLGLLKKFSDLGGTYTSTAAQKYYAGHDRVIIITDGQAHDGDPGRVIPPHVPVYTWNLVGYTATHGSMGSNARFELGGLTDKAFTLIPLLEAGAKGVWPWQVTAAA